MGLDGADEAPTGPTRPLVTIALIAYNQERFVREAVKGVLAQTYSPLEVILSDDCSTDNTYEEMCRIADRYSGPHKLLLMRNPANHGIGAHVNKVAELAKGELTVIAAGDDISMPERVEVLVGVWLAGERRAHSIYSSAMVVDLDGRSLGLIGNSPRKRRPVPELKSYMDGVMGCTHAWTQDVFRVFGPMLPGTTCEDRVIALRSRLLGEIGFCATPLVKYRMHPGSLSHHASTPCDRIQSRTVEIHRRNLNIAQNYVRDLHLAASHPRLCRTPWLEEGIATAERMAEHLADKVRFHAGGRAVKCRLILKYLLLHPAQAAQWLAVLLFPRLHVERQKRNLGVHG